MSAAEGTFRVEAEVVDKYSRPIRNFQHALNSIGTPRSAAEIKKDFDAVERSVKRATEAVAGGLRRALGGLGLVSISASAGLAAALGSIKSFSMGIGELRSISKETGYTVNAMRTLEAASARFHIAPATVRAGLKTFASNMYDFRRQMGSAYSTVLRLAPDLASSLKEASPDKAVEIALDFLARIEDRQTAGKISEVLFGSQDIARFGESGPKKLREELADVRKRIGEINPLDDEKARAFEEAVRRMNSSVEGLQKTITIAVAPELTKFAGWADSYIRTNSVQIKDGLRLTFSAIATAAKAVNDVVESSVGWDLLIKGIVLSKVAETAGSMLRLGVGFLTLGRSVNAANLAGLTTILAGLATVGYAFSKFRSSEGGDQKSKPEEAAKGSGSVAGATLPSLASPKKQDAPGTTTPNDRNSMRLGEAVKAGVAKGIERGLEAVQSLGEAGSGSGGIGGSARSGMDMLRNAMARGRGASFSGSDVQGLTQQGPVRGDLKSKAMRVMARLIALGWTPEAAASAVGQFTVEGFDPESGVTKRGGDKGLAHGIAQWHPDRWARFLQFAQERAKKLGVKFNPADIDAQVDFFDMERKHRTKAEASWHKETDLARGERLGWLFERYGSGTAGKRLGWSRRWLEEWKKGKEQVPKKTDQGAAFSGAKDAGEIGDKQSKVPLFIRMNGAPRSTNIFVDPGSAFSEAQVERKRPQ